MTPSDVEDPKNKLVDSLLRKVHEQSSDSPELSPFWREGPVRCEFHKQGGPPRLKVFRGEQCIHEEVVQSREAVEERSTKLKQTYAAAPIRRNVRAPE